MNAISSIIIATCFLLAPALKGVEPPEVFGGEPYGMKVVIKILAPSDSEYLIELTGTEAFWTYHPNLHRNPRPGVYSFRVPSLSFISQAGTAHEQRVIVSPAYQTMSGDDAPERIPLKLRDASSAGFIALFSAPKAMNTHKVVYRVSRDALARLTPPVILAIGEPVLHQLSP